MKLRDNRLPSKLAIFYIPVAQLYYLSLSFPTPSPPLSPLSSQSDRYIRTLFNDRVEFCWKCATPSMTEITETFGGSGRNWKDSMGMTRVSLKLHAATECVARHRKQTNNFSQLLNSRYEIISGNKS